MKTSYVFFKISMWIASIFSILSSLSIIKELKETGAELYVLLFSSLFIGFFIVITEFIKVRELHRYFSKVAYNVFLLIFSLTISISISAIGIYFWIDTSAKMENQFNKNHTEIVDVITSKYNAKIDSAQTLVVTSLPEYKTSTKSINYWKSRKFETPEERQIIRENVSNAERSLQTIVSNFNDTKKSQLTYLRDVMDREIRGAEANMGSIVKKASRNNVVTYIFFMIIVLIEVIIIIIQKEMCNPAHIKLNSEERFALSVATNLRLNGHNNIEVTANTIKYLKVSEDAEWDSVIKVFNMFKTIGVIEDGCLCKNAPEVIKLYYKELRKF